ncbi:DUF3558 domain-containing protein [Streptomyces sp. NPDC048330]|uniref:DUF3558 domain-containing protein n=1 Tax=Streptomyces sp. NPDC048330 TaxID=3365533 RepID=UPI0037205414
MQRKRYAPGRTRPTARTAVVLTSVLGLGLGLGLTGCSSGAPADDIAVDAKAGPAAPVAPPGRYRTLFEPCGAIPQAALKDLLPGAAALPDTERAKAYRGIAAVTYDTDRRVGCTWRADGPDTSHRLTLDIERVVSYDTTVSDADRAQEVFTGKQIGAGIPLAPTAPPTPTAPATTAPATTSPVGTPFSAQGKNPAAKPTATTAAPTPTPTGSGSPDPASTGLEPRLLDGLGDIAFLDDVLGKVGANVHQRSVSVVFRTSNVIVTVSYREQSTGSGEAPDSRELQEKARNLARLLADRLEE